MARDFNVPGNTHYRVDLPFDIVINSIKDPIGGGYGLMLDTDGSFYIGTGVPLSGISLDTDGTPYFNPLGNVKILLDTDGVPYISI